MSAWRRFVLRLMRVPHDPAPPPGSAPQTFRAASNYFYFKLIVWFLGNFVVVLTIGPILAVMAVALAKARNVPLFASVIFWTVAGIGLAVLLIRLTIGLAIVRLDYELRWYMISDRAIRIREGILTVREKTIALANIQNTVVRQGPLQRMLGIADVEVRTAGGGSGGTGGEGGKGGALGDPMHIGYFRGVDDAEGIRDVIQAGVRRYRDSGLGDAEETRGDPAERLLAEAVALREFLARRIAAGPAPS